MVLVGSGALGVVMGWLVMLIGSPVGVPLRPTWRIAGFALACWAGSCAMAWYFGGKAGVLCVGLGVLVGVATAATLRRRA
jgi:hypothetical protein